jgi:hypothetical protein
MGGEREHRCGESDEASTVTTANDAVDGRAWIAGSGTSLDRCSAAALLLAPHEARR